MRKIIGLCASRVFITVLTRCRHRMLGIQSTCLQPVTFHFAVTCCCVYSRWRSHFRSPTENLYGFKFSPVRATVPRIPFCFFNQHRSRSIAIGPHLILCISGFYPEGSLVPPARSSCGPPPTNLSARHTYPKLQLIVCDP
jgi:hypothetical protein